MRIHVLADDVTNKIAAGEVVERPASVVKELVENALDAGATDIRVELTDGGRRMIRVVDNGSGMDPDDARLCLQRHATSKISSADDLPQIATMGFRGEALPSIASVSRFELLTRTAESMEGTRVVVEHGRLSDSGSAGCPVGTRVSVADLFTNVPARLKFLKAEQTELSHAMNHVQWAALAFPHVRFVLSHNGKALIDVAPCTARDERIRLLYGKELSEHLISFTRSFESMTVEAHIGDPNLTKPNRSYQFLFLNQRPIRDRTIGAALSEAVKEVVPGGRHAVAFLFLTVSPDEVDVNVHPAKAEVRFRNERGLFRNVMQAISQGIGSSRYIPDVEASPASTQRGSGRSHQPRPAVETMYPLRETRVFLPPSQPNYVEAAEPIRAGSAEIDTRRLRFDTPPSQRTVGGRDVDASVELLDYESVALVGGLMDTYILVADGESLYFVDQHVASERIHFQRIRTQLASERVASQGLLTPLTVELSPRQRVGFEAHAVWLNPFGFDVSEFGGGSAIIRAIPSELEPERAERVLRDLLDRVEVDLNPEQSWDAIQEKAAATIACHAAVRAGDRLAPEAQRALLRDLSRCRLPFNCPHGRPIIVRMRRSEIETLFHRR